MGDTTLSITHGLSQSSLDTLETNCTIKLRVKLSKSATETYNMVRPTFMSQATVKSDPHIQTAL